MLLLARIVLTGCLLLCASALQVSLAQTLPDLQLSDAQWRSQVTYIGDKKNNADKSGRVDDDYLPDQVIERKNYWDRGVGEVYVASVRARNSGAKTIISVTWEYTFYKDAQMTQALRSHPFLFRTRIKPGKTQLLKTEYKGRPPESRFGAARVLSLEYDDGTVWKR